MPTKTISGPGKKYVVGGNTFVVGEKKIKKSAKKSNRRQKSAKKSNRRRRNL